MKVIAIGNIGFEDECEKEILNLCPDANNFEKKSGLIIFNVENLENIAKITYYSQTLYKIFLLISQGDSTDELENNLIDDKYKIFLEKSLKVFYKIIPSIKTYENSEEIKKYSDSIENNNHDKIVKFADSISKKIKDKLEIEIKISMTDFKTGIYIIEQDKKLYLGIDFSGKDLSKRDYRIFCHKNSLNATIASSLIYHSDIFEEIKKKSKEITILDPFCGSGTIPVEFALGLNKISPQRYEEDKLAYKNFNINFKKEEEKISEKIKIIGYDNLLPNIKASQKNSKIANINKLIEFSKVGTDWLDIKFNKNEIDYIITDPPLVSKASDEKEILKSYKELFYQAEYILKKNGKIIIICQSDKIIEFSEKFELLNKKEVFQGKQKMFVMSFCLKKSDKTK